MFIKIYTNFEINRNIISSQYASHLLCINQKVTYSYRFYTKMNIGASETTRENSFNFTPYFDVYKNTSFSLPNFIFLSWFIGFS